MTWPRLRVLLLALVLAAPSWAPSVAHATPQDLMGFGGRTPGLGMTGASYADNFEAAYANPAGLGRNGRMELMLGATGGMFRLQLDGEDYPVDSSQGMTIGFQLPLPFGGPLEDVLTLGAGFFTPFNTILRNDVRFAESPQWTVIDRVQVVALQIGFGIGLERWVPGLRLGVGISGLAQNSGTLDVLLDETNQFVSLTEVQLLADFSPIAGIQYYRDNFALGITYRSELVSAINLDIEVRNLPISLPTLGIDAYAHYDPHNLSVEGSWKPTPELMLVLNLTWRRWSAYPGPAGATTDRSNFPPAMNFHDTVSPRVGIEYTSRGERLSLSARGGALFEPTPAPRAAMAAVRDFNGDPLLDMDGNVVMQPQRRLDNSRLIVTAGFGLEWQTAHEPVLRVDLFGQAHALQRREHAVPAPGATNNMTTRGYMLVFGGTAGLAW